MSKNRALITQKLFLGLDLGKTLFFSAIFAPLVFKVLPRPLAAQLQSAIFPGYYTMGIACMIFWLAFYIREPSKKASRTLLSLGFLSLTLNLIGLLYFVPEIREMQTQLYATAIPPAEITEHFRFLHKVSVASNGINFLIICILAWI